TEPPARLCLTNRRQTDGRRLLTWWRSGEVARGNGTTPSRPSSCGARATSPPWPASGAKVPFSLRETKPSSPDGERGAGQDEGVFGPFRHVAASVAYRLPPTWAASHTFNVPSRLP